MGKKHAKMQAWVAARKRYRLSQVHVRMARELGLNPEKLGGLANHRQEPWKMPLPEYIEHLNLKRFGTNKAREIARMSEGVPPEAVRNANTQIDPQVYERSFQSEKNTQEDIPF